MTKLIEQTYGPSKITPNMYLYLHLVECIYDYGPLYSFWCYRSAFSYEQFPSTLLKLIKKNVQLNNELLILLTQYYNNLYGENFISINEATLYNKQIVIQSKIKQYGRFRLNSDIYELTIFVRHIKSSFVLVKFIQDNREIDTYSGQIQFFFEYTTLISDLTNHTHSLALIK
ncbi:hypothetical protein Glove_480g6 [Diversispora epigaea]|uniref:Uncharacterized protein n=1 Tax=Diversispora epigaea TaxID=1348612 RepID=A0A397GK62_9GLOM|nr:hypothetical protein Glove_480g6 [Diversispora epigaea]